jgi:hypothetical protein
MISELFAKQLGCLDAVLGQCVPGANVEGPTSELPRDYVGSIKFAIEVDSREVAVRVAEELNARGIPARVDTGDIGRKGVLERSVGLAMRILWKLGFAKRRPME